MTGRPQQRAKQSFYLTSQLKMSSLLDVVCVRLNDPFAVCWEQIRVWRCALHKIMLSQCAVDKFPNNKTVRNCDVYFIIWVLNSKPLMTCQRVFCNFF